jgi:hypothetical protein
LDQEQKVIDWITGAEVTIRDDRDNVVTLHEPSPGHYTTPSGFTGIVGRTYTLQITIADHERFESLPQKLLPAGQIKKVYYEFVQPADPSTSASDDPQNGFNIYVDVEVPATREKLVRWRTAGTFEIITFPEKRKRQVVVQNPKNPGETLIFFAPDPPACSGYIVVSDSSTAGWHFNRVGPCTCCSCWPTTYDKMPVLSDPEFERGNQVTHKLLAFVPADRRIFYKKYYFQVDQMSVTSEAYDFWKGIQKQNASGSDLFQTPGISTKGNIVPAGDTKTPVMGLFEVSSVASTSFFIDRSEIPYAMPPIDSVDQSCLTLFYRTNTTVKPPFW